MLDKIFGEDKEAKARQQIREAKNGVRNSFNEAAADVRVNLLNASQNKIEEIIAPAVRDFENQLEQFQSKRDRLKNFARELQNLLKSINALMDDVQSTAKN